MKQNERLGGIIALIGGFMGIIGHFIIFLNWYFRGMAAWPRKQLSQAVKFC
jgi:hypothetical protein